MLGGVTKRDRDVPPRHKIGGDPLLGKGDVERDCGGEGEREKERERMTIWCMAS